MTLPRLCQNALEFLPAHVRRPAYDRRTISPGIVHIGVGAFHRAHQAVYVDDVLAKDPRWGITGVSMRRPDTRDALAPQDFLYTVASRDEAGDVCRVIGSLMTVLVAEENIGAVLDRLTDPSTRIVSLTVTEKGYCLDPISGRLDTSHPDIVTDLDGATVPRSLPALIVAGLRKRRGEGHPPFTLVSCDNLRKNGELVRQAVTDYAALTDPELARWIEDRLACPSTMVDRIVPRTTPGDRTRIAGTCGSEDAWPVVAEPFGQWVIENDFALGIPPFASPDISLVKDVRRHEEMKLRVLNGSHTALAYIGLLAGHTTVARAMADRNISLYLKRLAEGELLPTLATPEGVDLSAYVKSVHARFANAGMNHALEQIAADGSQKLPQRLLPAARTQASRGALVDAIAIAIAAWIGCWHRAARGDNGPVLSDPLANRLRAAAGRHDTPTDTVGEFLVLDGVFQSGDAALLGDAVSRHLARIIEGSISEVLASSG